MKLYMVERVFGDHETHFYWADNEGDALEQHEKLRGVDDTDDWVATPVWADNDDKRYRGYVVKENHEN